MLYIIWGKLESFEDKLWWASIGVQSLAMMLTSLLPDI
jgi:hypothetical protein